MTTAPDDMNTAPHAGAGNRLFCFGFGYSAQALAQHLYGAEFQIAGTRRALAHPAPAAIELAAFDGQARSTAATKLLHGSTHVLLSVPPGADGDPVYRHHAGDLARLAPLQWLGYLSTVGVYGDTDGAWVDETSPVRPGSERGRRRAAAEAQWRAFGQQHGKRVEIFRLPGIYGPGRSAIEAIREQTARRIVKPSQVFNRIHVADIVATLARAMRLAASGQSPALDTFNVVDDEPAPPQDVVAYAAALLGVPPPPEQPFEWAGLSPMGRSFYGENKRVSNDRLKAALGVTLSYPTYRAGLRAIAEGLK